MASYPTAAKTFTTKSSNDDIEASHVNDLQDEVTAVESALLTSLQHDLLFTDATYDIGKSGATRPRDGFFSRDLSIGRNATIVGTLDVDGAVDLDSTLDVAELITARKGIVFPATQVASSNVNTLDDYEEGIFSPTITGATSSSGQVYAVQEGFYQKVGKTVKFFGRVGLSTLGTITGAVCIGGLPFTTMTNTGHAGLAQILCNGGNLSTSVVSLQGLILSNNTKIELMARTAAAAGESTLSQSDLAATTQLYFAGFYFTTD